MDHKAAPTVKEIFAVAALLVPHELSSPGDILS